MSSDVDPSSGHTPPAEPAPGAVAAFWKRALAATALRDDDAPVPPSWCFGDSAALADELIDLVLNGPKRATAASAAEHEVDGEALPRPGDLSIVTDGSGRPRALLETTEVRVGPLSSVDDQFAWDEGEGDRSREWWLDAHTRYFTRTHARLGIGFTAEIPVVFERFALRYQEE